MHTIFWLENLKRSLERPRRRCEDNIRMDLRKVEWDVVDCNKPSGFISHWYSCTFLSHIDLF
jgi:hypothetical protein